MRRQYDFILSTYIDAPNEATLRKFANKYLGTVLETLRSIPLPAEEECEYPKRMTIKMVTVQRKNQRREP